jgi:hypothetical protein
MEAIKISPPEIPTGIAFSSFLGTEFCYDRIDPNQQVVGDEEVAKLLGDLQKLHCIVLTGPCVLPAAPCGLLNGPPLLRRFL